MDTRELVGAKLTCVDLKHKAGEIDEALSWADAYIPMNNRDVLGFRTICPYCRVITDFVNPTMSARGKLYRYICWDCDGEQIINIFEVATYLFQRSSKDKKRTRTEKRSSVRKRPTRKGKKV